MSQPLRVYRPYHIITSHDVGGIFGNTLLHIVDSNGAILHRITLPNCEVLQFYVLTKNRFAIFYATLGRLKRFLHVYESTTFTLLKSIPFDTSILALIQLRETGQIVVLTVAQGFHIYSEKLEFEQKVNRDGVLVECLHQLPDREYMSNGPSFVFVPGLIMTATSDYYLHFWNSKTWTEVASIKLLPTSDRADLYPIHRIVHWRESIILIITEHEFILHNLHTNKCVRNFRCIDGNKDNYPIMLKDAFLYRYGHNVRMYTDDFSLENQLFMKQLPFYSKGVSFADGRILLETKGAVEYAGPVQGEFVEPNDGNLVEFEEDEFKKVRTRKHVNEFRFVFALHTKHDQDLMRLRLDPFLLTQIPILDIRLIVYEFI